MNLKTGAARHRPSFFPIACLSQTAEFRLRGDLLDTVSVGEERRASIKGIHNRLDELAALVGLRFAGPGGVGKTRLALQIVADLAGHFDRDLQFVSLSPIRDPELVLPALAQAVGLVALGDQSPKAGLLRFLDDRNYLLVIDNFEHLVAAAQELSDLLARSPGLKMLVTSREPLRIAGEHEFPVPTLSVPERGSDTELLLRSDAVELFRQRAKAVKPDFSPTPETAGAIADICIKLDGLPLAIELAASRMKILSPRAIQARLVDRLALLSRDGRDVPHRLRTMLDAVGWSYDLLTDEERDLFRRLSVFAGGCTIETAAGVLGIEEEGDLALLFEGMTSLVDKSLLVQSEQSSGEPRFRMLETIRAYGLEQLDAHGEEEAIKGALARWLIARTANAFDEQWGPARGAWAEFFDDEIDNCRAAIEWLLAHHEGEGAFHLVSVLIPYWQMRGNFSEALSWVERALQIEGQLGFGAVQSRLRLMMGWLLYHVGDHERAISTLERAREDASAAGDQDVVALSWHVLGAIHDGFGRFDDAMRCFERTLEHYVATDHADWHGHSLNGLAHTNFERGEIDLAERQFEEALSIFRSRNNTYGLGIVLTNLAKVARARGDPGRALGLYNESLAMRWQVGDKLGLVGCLRGLGQTYVLVGMWELAARLLGADTALRDAIGASLPQHRARYDQSVRRLKRELGEDRFTVLFKQGRSSPLGDIVLEALERTAAPGSPGAIAFTGSATSFDLTARELEVLSLVCEGLTNRAIGERLFVSERTAQSHVQHIFDKLDVHNRAAAVAIAIAQGLV